ncbi:hypothetical protein CRUP_025961 [Coryphaenoides rupestris]|nr:hypothetical protein CRUP_025961 [Coryphaenoides rupestris]
MFRNLEKTPRTVLVCERSNMNHEKATLCSHVEKHYFNYKVSLLVPGCDRLPAELDAALNGMRSFLLVRDLPLARLLDQDFLDQAVYKGKLVLSVVKDTYEVLGLEGKPSKYQHKPAGRYENLSVVGGASSPAVSLLSNHKLSEHRPRVSSTVMTSLACPTLVTSDLQQQSCDPQSFLEWLGAVDAGVTFEDESGGYLSIYECPQPQTVVGGTVRCSVTGLLLPEDIYHLLDILRPVSWGTAEHGFLSGGENFYTVVLFQNLDYWLCMATGPHDACPP